MDEAMKCLRQVPPRLPLPETDADGGRLRNALHGSGICDSLADAVADAYNLPLAGEQMKKQSLPTDEAG